MSHQRRRVLTALLLLLAGAALAAGALPVASADDAGDRPPGPLIEECDGPFLDGAVWRLAQRQWGGAGVNGGVLPALVGVHDGYCHLVAHGDRHQGLPIGIDKDCTPRDDGTRVGGVMATRAYYGSGRYEVRMKVAPRFGVATAMWTFHYIELYPGDPGYVEKPVGGTDYYAVNHEIDIEMPGRPGPEVEAIGFDHALMNTWIGENADEHTTNYVPLPPQDDGGFHVYRFDWHTGGGGEQPRVEFYVDDVLVHVEHDHVPQHAGRFMVGVWFPNRWAGRPAFATTEAVVDWVRITPFHEPNDVYLDESYPDEGFADSPIPCGPPVVFCDGHPAIAGSSGDDLIVGSPLREVFHAGGGNDTVRGRGGDDLLCGGDGDDLLVGGAGADTLFGGRGFDSLVGGSGGDLMRGGPGDDVLAGRTGADVAAGNAGADVLFGAAGPDRLFGGPGDDHMFGGAGDDHLDGQGGTDTARGGGDADVCRAESQAGCER